MLYYNHHIGIIRSGILTISVENTVEKATGLNNNFKFFITRIVILTEKMRTRSKKQQGKHYFF